MGFLNQLVTGGDALCRFCFTHLYSVWPLDLLMCHVTRHTPQLVAVQYNCCELNKKWWLFNQVAHWDSIGMGEYVWGPTTRRFPWNHPALRTEGQ